MPSHRHPKLKTLACAAMLLSATLAQQAQAQDAAQDNKLQRVEVTGTSIKRLEGETALPVQVMTREDIAKAAVTNAAELLSKISASAANVSDAASLSDIPGQRGFAGANLRGVGVSSTLVLLNGRRVANFASPGSSAGVDLNSIPTTALQRVEVLKDGASAIYGTDAIAGVINFITRQDYRGVDLYAYYSDTQDGGGGKTTLTAAGGVGDLASDGYNLMAVLDVSKTDALRSSQRDWIGSVYQPDINLDVGSSNTFPANARKTTPSGGATGSRANPSAPNCNPPANVYAPGSFVGPNACLYDYMQDTLLIPKNDKVSLLSRAQVNAGSDHTLFAELLLSNTKSLYRISPLTITNLNYPAGGKYYPTNLFPGYSGALRTGLRLNEAGGRTNEIDADTSRLVIGSKGLLAGWDYNTAINHSESKVTDAYIDGYVKTSSFDTLYKSGNLNPFGPTDAAGLSALAATKINDEARKSKGTTTSFDFSASREVFEMSGGMAALALGMEYREEKMEFRPSELLQTGEIRGDGAAAAFDGKRHVAAVYGELNLPLAKTLEAQLALRYDDYSDAGSTTNPKLGLRWTPMKELLLRSSYGTGFRAPTLPDLYAPARLGQTNGIYDDAYCAQVKASFPNSIPDYCGLQPAKQVGGSASLKPEESKQFSAGLVFELSRNFNGSLDYWRIEKTNTIVSPEGLYFSDPVKYASYITRDPKPLSASIPGFITEIDGRLRNAGELNTSGLDLSLEFRAPAASWGQFSAFLNGTYVIDFDVADFAGDAPVSGVGKFAGDQVVQRWRHTAGVTFDSGPFSTTLTNTYYSSYQDQQPLADGSTRTVKAYSLWDLTGSYAVNKAFKLRAGIKNLLDTAPPVSNQVYSFLAGYDPSYTDPKGRLYFVSASYSFK
ncbi:TonB-dependent receptor [Roseateles violae]|uniref:TonB-dependent receptor n=1 Tax=Roseateles violae TaxID=3058042 RepID=A0ABT8DVA4_9BURK|nr:TonB-dependent receptor [Pelomonas sp. PFR6]MDN3920101.1 TonB-dependent receptor [Pelomonas sp. PFR6]